MAVLPHRGCPAILGCQDADHCITSPCTATITPSCALTSEPRFPPRWLVGLQDGAVPPIRQDGHCSSSPGGKTIPPWAGRAHANAPFNPREGCSAHASWLKLEYTNQNQEWQAFLDLYVKASHNRGSQMAPRAATQARPNQAQPQRAHPSCKQNTG